MADSAAGINTHLNPRFFPSATRPLAKFSAVPVCEAKKMLSGTFDVSSVSGTGRVVAGPTSWGASFSGAVCVVIAAVDLCEDINHQMVTAAASAAATIAMT